MKTNSKMLLELLEATFDKFRSIALKHDILLTALEQAKVRKTFLCFQNC